ncbi:phage holin family protein [Rahnella aquatilis]|uniref:phage holin family protein n=1 Tax=Rahnella aquatilis TaxID=34038 RepID=UPI003B75B970
MLLPWREQFVHKYHAWLLIILFGAWGGVVKHIIDVKAGKTKSKILNIIAQVIISAFAGTLSGLFFDDLGSSFHIALGVAGISGAMGIDAIHFYWRRFTGTKDG